MGLNEKLFGSLPSQIISRAAAHTDGLSGRTMILVWRFEIGSTNIPLIDTFLYSHHSSARYGSKEKFFLGH